jgi:hypothetical protein
MLLHNPVDDYEKCFLGRPWGDKIIHYCSMSIDPIIIPWELDGEGVMAVCHYCEKVYTGV